MGKRVLVASGETGSTVPSNGSTVKFPPSGNIWNDRHVTNVKDVRVMASLSASGNYSMRLMASFQDPSSGSVYDGVVEQFTPSDTLGASNGQEVFRSEGAHTHFEWLEIEFSSTGTDMTVHQLGVLWKSHDA